MNSGKGHILKNDMFYLYYFLPILARPITKKLRHDKWSAFPGKKTCLKAYGRSTIFKGR